MARSKWGDGETLPWPCIVHCLSKLPDVSGIQDVTGHPAIWEFRTSSVALPSNVNVCWYLRGVMRANASSTSSRLKAANSDTACRVTYWSYMKISPIFCTGNVAYTGTESFSRPTWCTKQSVNGKRNYIPKTVRTSCNEGGKRVGSAPGMVELQGGQDLDE